MVIPRVKKEISGQGILTVNGKISLSACVEDSAKACKALEYFLPQCVAVAQEENAVISAEKTDSFKVSPEEYELKISSDGVFIKYFSYLGLRNALAALSLKAVLKDGILQFSAVEIEDFPAASHRGVMLDLARGIKPFDILINDIILIAKSRMNYVHFHLADSKGVCIQLDSLPELCWLDGAYTKEQIKTVCELADVLGLEIIPEYDMPAHSDKLLEVFEDFKCLVDDEDMTSRWVVCAGQERIYPLYEAVIGEITSLIPGRYFHIGGDELEFADVPELNSFCYWDSCARCNELRKRENLADRQDVYYYFVKRIHEIVKKNGRTMIMWSDQIDCKRDAVLPNDIIMQFWRVAEKGRGPYESCSMNAQLDMGYTVINSFFPETYVDVECYMSSASLSKWRWDTVPECSEQNAERIIGSEMCAWEYGNDAQYSHYDHSFASSVVLMGDKLWNGDILEYTEEYCCALTRTLLGAGVKENTNIFKCIGDIIPPKTTDKSYYDKVTVSCDEIKEVIGVLSEKDRYVSGDAIRANIYRECAEFTLEKIKDC